MNKWKHPMTDWSHFSNHFFKQKPFFNQDSHLKGIQNFVQKSINQYLPKSTTSQTGFHPFGSSTLDYDIFETHRSIFVRCKLPAGTSLMDMKFLANRKKLRIHLPESTEEISLPSDIHVSRVTAKLQDGILEIRMPKIRNSEPFREIFIRDGDVDQAK